MFCVWVYTHFGAVQCLILSPSHISIWPFFAFLEWNMDHIREMIPSDGLWFPFSHDRFSRAHSLFLSHALTHSNITHVLHRTPKRTFTLRGGKDKSLTHKYLNPITFATLSFFPSSANSFRCICVRCLCLFSSARICCDAILVFTVAAATSTHYGSHIWFCIFRRLIWQVEVWESMREKKSIAYKCFARLCLRR